MPKSTDRVTFHVYKTEQDNYDGEIVTRLGFVRHDGDCKHHPVPGTALSTHDTMDGGRAGTITAPAGSQLAETASGDTILALPDGSSLSADEARLTSGWRYGLTWSPASHH